MTGLIPLGMSGLKYRPDESKGLWCGLESHPAWDEWIEIFYRFHYIDIFLSHPAWDEWIEMLDRVSYQ